MRAFIVENTAVAAPGLVPEVRFHLVTELTPLWRSTTHVLEREHLPPPFWAFAWAGGQGLARYVLDHAHEVRGKRVFDFATGSGLVAIAAARAGAARVAASEVDPFSVEAARLNAALNEVTLDVVLRDVIGDALADFDVVLAGDVFYEKPLAEEGMRWFRNLARRGASVLVGDPGRVYSQAEGLEPLATYGVPTSREIEDDDLRPSRVLRVIG
jgi:predicted nicotinamide N-methyase